MVDMPGEWGPRFEEIFGVIVGWRARAEQDPLEPDPHSSLAADDTAFPQMPASRIAYNGLAVAVEYLDFFRTSLTGAGTVYPTAHYTVLRSALMGAAQAVWVLAGPRHLRQQHALGIVIDDCNQERKFFNDLGELTPEEQAVVNGKLTTLDQRLTDAATAANQLGMTIPDITKFKVNTTAMIAEATKLAFPQDAISARQVRDSVAILWRSASGHAHGTPSRRMHLIPSADLTHTSRGSSVGRPVASLNTIGAAAGAVILLAQEAWRLYDCRCEPLP